MSNEPHNASTQVITRPLGGRGRVVNAGTLELVELDPRLDFDHVPTCEVLTQGCNTEADLIEINHCCGATYYACTPHAKQLDEWVALLERFHCNSCMADMPTYTWKPVK